jgi:hypothetical protein
MFKKAPIRKIIALTLTFCVLNNILTPSLVFALTAGPENPDVTSFEPVDTTDMVNLLTGDLAYNIPLLEVPGPEGGYPLSLSYHAGIMPDEEATWTGLGWSLSPGSVNRTVSGFPDDFNGQQNVVRDYWAGGSTSTTSVGVNIGITGALSAEFGLSISHDTMQGTGIGGYVGMSAGYDFGGGVGGSASIGLSFDPFGGTSIYGGVGIGVSMAKSGGASLNAGLGLGFTANSKGFNMGAGVGLSASISRGSAYEKGGSKQNSAFGSMSQSLLGASISSGGGGVSLTTGGGYSSVENVNAGRIQTQSRGWGITIPVWFGISISLKRNFTRYWSDETASVRTFGTLNYPKIAEEIGYYNTEYDSYYLADINDPTYTLLGKNDPVKSTGGTFPDYDTYSVLGQGVSGYMRPYGYQMQVIGKGKYYSGYTTNRTQVDTREEYICDFDWTTGNDYNCRTETYYTTHINNPDKLNFRFINDFSNNYIQQSPLVTNVSNINFDTNPTHGNNDGNYGYDPATERLASSKNIEYFTNDEIKNGSAKLKGFINTQATGFDRAKNPNGSSITTEDRRIGGFMITNESGVTYHYALPVYAYDELTRTENTYDTRNYNQQTRPNPYATSWLLTAVTGPDYVDTNNNGLSDQGDWGYWVSCEYGKWTGDYKWRNPGVGFKKDMDARFKYYSTGKKEIYYLDAIVTPSHTALFEKELRADGKGTASNNGYDPYNGMPHSLLRLNNIILVNNSSLQNGLNALRTSSGAYNSYGIHLGNNIIDKFDVAQLALSQEDLLRKIHFGYDYSLCPQTPNSFDEAGSLYDVANTNTSIMPRLGKLTLNQVQFLGKGGEANIPAMTFDYEIPDDLANSTEVEYVSKKPNSDIYTFVTPLRRYLTNSPFIEGSIVKFNFNGTTFYALIKQAVENQLPNDYSTKTFEVKFLATPPYFPTGHDRYVWSATKNPPYAAENYDMWGMFKGDFQAFNGNENLARLPSKASAQSVDVWSLRRIHHALGMTTDIVYESDTYNKVALYRNAAIQVSGVEDMGNSYMKINSTGDFGIDLRDFIKQGDKIKVNLSGQYDVSGYDDQYGTPTTVTQYINPSSGNEPTLLVTAVSENYVVINDATFYNEVFVVQPNASYTHGNMTAGGIGNNYGGGLRVKQVINREPITDVKMTVNYNYNRAENQSLSSGTTSYEPLGLDAVELRGGADQIDMLKSFSKLLGISREVPAPGIMYEYVTVTTERTTGYITVQQLGKTEYQFEVFKEGMVGIWNLNPVKTQYQEMSTILLQNYASRIGNLRRMIQYDVDGNKLSELVNHYLHDEQQGQSADANRAEYEPLLARYNKQGLIMEQTVESRYNDGKSRAVLSTRANYPSVMTGTASIDYKTGIRTGSQTLAFDFYSGQPVKTLTTDGYGNRFVSESKPAYRFYPDMGLKFINTKNANMLSQTAEELVYKVDQNNNPTGLLTANATTWSNQSVLLNDSEQEVNSKNAHSSEPNIWRKNQTYQWMPQERTGGLTNSTEFASFFNGGQSLPDWSLTGQITLYNKYSSALEAKDMNSNYASNRMGYRQSKIVATASPASYYEMNYTGLEDETIGAGILARGFNLGNATLVQNVKHTGEKSAMINPGQSGISYTVNSNKLKSGRNYSASVWMKQQGNGLSAGLYYRINGAAMVTAVATANKKAGDWYLVNLQIPGSSIPTNANIEIGCFNNGPAEAYFDDLRFKPINASMNTYVYNAKSGELEYTLDNSNIFTHFEYDSQSRLIKTYRETFGYGVKPVGEFVYNYAKSLKGTWQNTGIERCQTVNGATTGLREIQQVDVNILSTTYLQNRWIVAGSSSACGANPESCAGPDRKYINGNCTTGYKEYTRSVRHNFDNGYTCYFWYTFSDGTHSPEYSEENPYECNLSW